MNNKKYDGIYYPTRQVTDMKDMIRSSTTLFRDIPAYLQKDKPGGTFQPVTYGEVREKMDALGTRLLDLGLSGKKIAVVGESCWQWILTYFTVVCGVGTIVPLDKNLPVDEMKNLVERSGASALVYTSAVKNPWRLYLKKNIILNTLFPWARKSIPRRRFPWTDSSTK